MSSVRDIDFDDDLQDSSPPSKEQELIRGELVRATYKGDGERVEALIQTGGNVNAKDINDFRKPPLLQIAAACGHFEVVEILLERGAEIDAIDKYGYTALHKACKEGHGRIVQLLLREGASVYVQEKYEDQLEVACRNGAYDVVESLINRGRKVNDVHLKAAYMAKRRDVAEVLIRNGVLTPEARTDIHMICFLGLDHAFEIVVNAESLEAKDSDGMTPIMVAARCGHLRIVKRCLAKGACIEITDVRKNSPLHHATIGGHEDIVRSLVQNGATVENKESKGRSALHLACLKNQLTVCETLLQYGAPVNDLDIYGRAPLFYARSVNVATELLRFGADVNSRDSYNRTVLHVACEGKDVEPGVLDILLSNGVQLVAQDWRGNMATVNAAANAQGELLEKVINFTAQKSPKQVKEMLENLEQALLQNMGLLKNMHIVDSLLKCGVNLDTTDDHDRTPLFKALELYIDLMKDYPHLPTPEFLITDIRLFSFAGTRLDIIFAGDLLTYVYRVSAETLHFFLAMGCGTECSLTPNLLEEILGRHDLKTLECLREFGYSFRIQDIKMDSKCSSVLYYPPKLTSLCRCAIRKAISMRGSAGGGEVQGVRRLSNRIKGLVRSRFFREGRSSRLVMRSIPLVMIKQLPLPPKLLQFISFEIHWCVP